MQPHKGLVTITYVIFSPYWSCHERIVSTKSKVTQGKCKIVISERTTPMPCTEGNTTRLKRHIHNDHLGAYLRFIHE